jgi:hypothetical protein
MKKCVNGSNISSAEQITDIYIEEHYQLINTFWMHIAQLVHTGCDWKLRKIFKHKFHIAKQGKMSTPTCVPKYLICEFSLKECDTCMMVFRHILAVLCEMFSVTWLMDKDRRTHCMASMLHARFESSAFLPVGTPKIHVYAYSVDNKRAIHRCIVDACQTIRNYATSLNGHGGLW